MSSSGSGFSDFFLALMDVCAMIPSARIPAGATVDELGALEAELGFSLPEDLRTALLLCDGLQAPELAGPGSDHGLLSASAIAERWRFQRELDDSVDRRLLPIADDNGVLRYLVLIPGSRHFGAVATWDSDGDSWGDIGAHKRVPGLRALLERALPKLQRQVPRDQPVLAGSARGRLPDATETAALLASLQRSMKRGKPVHERLAVFTRSQALLTALVEGLLDIEPQLLAGPEYHSFIAQAAATADVSRLLAALCTHPPAQLQYGPRLLADWSGDLDDLMTTLMVRAPAEVERRSGEFSPAISLGHTLVRVRLGGSSRDALSAEVLRRLVRECVARDHCLRPDGRGGVVRVERRPDEEPLDFTLGPLFPDLDALAREVVIFGLEGAPSPAIDPPRGWVDRDGRWMLGPALRVATPEQLATLLQRVLPHDLTLISAAPPAPGRTYGELLAGAAACITSPARRKDVRPYVTWVAYLLAVRDGQPLPDCDLWLEPTHKDRDEPRVDPSRYAPVVVALGPERCERLLAAWPVARWTLLQATPPAFRQAVDAWLAARELRDRPPPLPPVTDLAGALDALVDRGPRGVHDLLAATTGPLHATVLRHAHRVVRGGALALATALLEQGDPEPRARALAGQAGVVVRRALDSVPAVVSSAFELGIGDVRTLSRTHDGRVLAGASHSSPVLLDLDAHTQTTLGPPGRPACGMHRALPDGRMVGYRGCELALFAASGELLAARKSGYQRIHPEPEHLRATPDGRLIATGTPDGGVRLHAISRTGFESGKPANLRTHTNEIDGLSIDAAGARLVSHCRDDRAVVWDLATRKSLGSFVAQSPGPCELTPSGARLVARTDDALVQYDVATGEVVRRVELPATFLGACLGEDRFACSDFVGELQIVDFAAGLVGRVHATGRRIFSMLALDDDRLVLGGTDGQVRVISTRRATLEPTRLHTVVAIAVAPDDSAVAAWQARRLGNPPGWLLRPPAPWRPVHDAALLAVAAPAGEQRGQIRRTTDEPASLHGEPGLELERHLVGREVEAFIVTTGADGSVKFWRGKDRTLAARVDLDGPIGGLATSDDAVVVALDHGGLVWLDIAGLR